jgi:hypothetical protein
MLHKSVLDNITDHLTKFEGYRTYIYVDVKGIATTGIGNRVEPYSTYGKNFVFYKRADSMVASAAEVQAEINACKMKGYQSKLYTTWEQVRPKVIGAFTANADLARTYFGSDFDRYPADVQVVLSQMGYAGGLVSRRKNLEPYLKKRDFAGAMSYTTLGTGYAKYNAAFRLLMTNGWIVEQCALKGSSMKYWAPKDITVFYGIKNFLQLSRWYTGNDMSYEVRTTDIVTMGDASNWLAKQTN